MRVIIHREVLGDTWKLVLALTLAMELQFRNILAQFAVFPMPQLRDQTSVRGTLVYFLQFLCLVLVLAPRLGGCKSDLVNALIPLSSPLLEEHLALLMTGEDV